MISFFTNIWSWLWNDPIVRQIEQIPDPLKSPELKEYHKTIEGAPIHYRIRAAAQYVGISEGKLRDLENKKMVRAHRSKGKHRVFFRDDLDKLIVHLKHKEHS